MGMTGRNVSRQSGWLQPLLPRNTSPAKTNTHSRCVMTVLFSGSRQTSGGLSFVMRHTHVNSCTEFTIMLQYTRVKPLRTIILWQKRPSTTLRESSRKKRSKISPFLVRSFICCRTLYQEMTLFFLSSRGLPRFPWVLESWEPKETKSFKRQNKTFCQVFLAD